MASEECIIANLGDTPKWASSIETYHFDEDKLPIYLSISRYEMNIMYRYIDTPDKSLEKFRLATLHAKINSLYNIHNKV